MINKGFTKVACITMLVLMTMATATAGNKLPLTDGEKEWLEQVDPIITLKEKKVFKKRLTNHQIREEYMDLFWAKRDPDLTTEVNEFKEAYLVRLAEADKKWAYQNSRPGTMTMKELYIMLGEPTRRTSGMEPAFSRTLHPRTFRTGHFPETWEYRNVGYGFRHKKLIIQFIPTSTFGDFVALSDKAGEHFLNTLRKRLVVSPDLETPMVTTPES